MYLTLDIASPIHGAHIVNTKVRNLVLKFFPQKTIDGVKVFDNFYLYRSGQVQKDDNHKALYKIFGISVKDLEEQSYKKIDSVYLYFRPPNYRDKDNPLAYTREEFISYIKQNSVYFNEQRYYEIQEEVNEYNQDKPPEEQITLESKLKEYGLASKEEATMELYITYVQAERVSPLSAESVKALFSKPLPYISTTTGGKMRPVITQPVVFSQQFVYDPEENPLSLFVLMDYSDAIFRKEITITPGELITYNSINLGNRYNTHKKTYAKSYNIKISFYRHSDLTDQPALDAIDQMVNYLNKLDLKLLEYEERESIRKQSFLYNAPKDDISPANSSLGSDYFKTASHFRPATSDLFIYSNYHWYLTVDGFKNMKTRDAVLFLGQSLNLHIQKKKKSFLERILAPLIAIISLLLAIPTGGASLTMTAFLTILAINLTIIIAIETIIAYLAARAGWTTFASIMGRAVILTNYVLQLTTILLMAANAQAMVTAFNEAVNKLKTEAAQKALESAAQKAMMTAGEEIAVQSIEVVQPSFVDYVQAGFEQVITGMESDFSNKTTMEIINKVLSWLNKGFNAYVNYIAPRSNPGDPLPTNNRPQENMMQPQLVQYEFESYDFLDINEKMDRIPYILTEGTIENTFTKYTLN